MNKKYSPQRIRYINLLLNNDASRFPKPALLDTEEFYEKFALYSYYILPVAFFIFLFVKTNLATAFFLWIVLIIPIFILWGIVYIFISVILKNFAIYQRKFKND